MVLPPNHPKSDRFNILKPMVTWRCSKPGPNIASPLGMGKPLSSSEDQTSRKSLPQMYLRRFEASKRFQGGSCKISYHPIEKSEFCCRITKPPPIPRQEASSGEDLCNTGHVITWDGELWRILVLSCCQSSRMFQSWNCN